MEALIVFVAMIALALAATVASADTRPSADDLDPRSRSLEAWLDPRRAPDARGGGRPYGIRPHVRR
jgi:hypothetical protein